MSAATEVVVRDLTDGIDNRVVDVSDMPAGDLTVEHILMSAGVQSSKSAILVDGKKITDTSTMVAPGAKLTLIPNVDNG